jgi:hypothetical protein
MDETAVARDAPHPGLEQVPDMMADIQARLAAALSDRWFPELLAKVKR